MISRASKRATSLDRVIVLSDPRQHLIAVALAQLKEQRIEPERPSHAVREGGSRRPTRALPWQCNCELCRR